MKELSTSETDISHYHYGSSELAHTSTYLLPNLIELVRQTPPPARIFELGCGNGSVANELALLGYEVTAVDPSTQGISLAMQAYKTCRFAVGSAYDELAKHHGTFDMVVSLEVIEHVFYPRLYAKAVAELVRPNGTAIISTPYHGYLKNLGLSIMNRWDAHMDPLWDYGHIKLWSRKKLNQLFKEAGLTEKGFYRVGRIPQLAKSMILTYKKDL